MASEYIRLPMQEHYISGLYSLMCQKGLSVAEYPLDFHVSYGTPKECVNALNSKYFLEFARGVL